MGKHSADSGPNRPLAALVGLIVLALAAGTFYVTTRGAGEPGGGSLGAPGCTGTAQQTTVAVTPAMVDVATAAAARVTRADPCQLFTLTPTESVTAALSLIAGGQRPAGWISDSTMWVDSVRAAKSDLLTNETQELAVSPLVFAVPASVSKAAGATLKNPSWTTLLGGTPGLPVRFTDPEQTTGGRLTLFSAATAIGNADATRLVFGKGLLGWSRSAMPAEQEVFDASTTDKAAIFPTSEQAVAAYDRSRAGALTAVVPSQGTGTFDYSLVGVTDSTPAAARAVSALGAQLTNDTAKKDLTAAGFRPDDKASGPGVPGVAAGPVKSLPAATTDQQASLMKTWAGVKTDARMLAMIDTSGSMKEVEGGRTRMQLAADAAATAVGTFPATTQVGLWSFGIDRGGPGRDWQEIVPIRQLDTTFGGKQQRRILTESLPGLSVTASGGTGLYDTVLAAYTEMVASYTPGRINSIILLTDGKNDDRAGISLEDLLARIGQLKDPDKPVVVVTVGMGKDVDTGALSAVAAVTGGKVYIAENPQDIQQVFIDAVLSRDCGSATCTTK